MAWDGPKWGREVLFPANPDLADILGDTDFDFENFYFFMEFCASMPLAGQGGWKMAPIYLEAFNLWVRCRRRFFFSEKWPPYFWKP